MVLNGMTISATYFQTFGQGRLKIAENTVEPREKSQGGGTLIWASLANIEIKVPPRLFHLKKKIQAKIWIILASKIIIILSYKTLSNPQLFVP